MTAARTLSASERAIELDAEFATLAATRARHAAGYENALAAGHDVAGLREALDVVDLQLEELGSVRRGIERMRLAEMNDAHLAGIREAEELKIASTAARNAGRAEYEAVCQKKFWYEDSELRRLAVEEDNSITRGFRRRDAYAKFQLEHPEVNA